MKAINIISTMVVTVFLLAFSVPVQAANMDNAIEKSVKDSYVFQTYLQDDDIKVKSKDGIVTLTGTVSEESHKTMAEDTASGFADVKRVENKLEVKADRPAVKSDAWLVTKVKTTLLFHRHVSAMTEVDVKDGIVTLRGDAENQAQKDLTTEYVRDIEGVKDVKNEMTVAKGPKEKRTTGDKIDDSSITAQVKMSLLYHRSTSGLKTKVETKDGVVTLSGTAKNSAEKDLATKYAKDVNGVKSVENLMTIE
ncbi:MAG: BON domain-containing protein [Desulfuromonadales bacterium]|nr:BON domain-containing protein [Desulfuromonadales bacterium]